MKKLVIKTLFTRKPPAHQGIEEATPSAGAQRVKHVAIWIKANFLLVTLSIVSIGAFVAATIVSGSFSRANVESAESLGSTLEGLTKLERTRVSISIPGNDPVEGTVAVNKKLVDLVKERMAKGVSDGGAVTQSALKHNKGGHTPVMSLRLAAGDSKRQQIHLDLSDALSARYTALVQEVRGALPPAEADVLVELQRCKLGFVQSELNQSLEMPLTSEQQARLTAELTARRLNAYRVVAVNAGMYLDASDIGARAKPPTTADLEQLWFSQWKFWVAEDIIHACSKLNQSASIVTAPVKRIVGMQFVGLVGGAASASSGSAETAPPPEGTDPSTPADGQSSTGAPIDPNAPVMMTDFASSFQGWSSNQLYDVYRTRVSMVVQTSAIPLVTDALVQENFMAITDVKILPLDPFAAIRSGYFYGEQPVSTLSMTLESVWLRQWTGPLMPDEVRARLGTSGLVQSAIASDGAEVANPPN